MAIKVTTPETANKNDKSYPKLMKDENGDVFYMVRERYGLPLTDLRNFNWAFDDEHFADFSKDYRTFTDYNDPITIQNA